MIISIGGKPGSGKSTLAKMLAEKLEYKRYYIGKMRRDMARERGMTLEELNKLGENESWTDLEVDEYQKKLGKAEDNFIIEGRTSFIMISHSLKIFIDVDERAGAERIFKDLQKNSDARNEADNLNSVEDVIRSNRIRMRSDQKRYIRYYATDFLDLSRYDFILDTTHETIQSAFDKFYEFVRSHLDTKV